MVLRGDGEVHERYCPRCACDLDEIIDYCTPQQAEDRKMWREVLDLCLIYQNWKKGFLRVLSEGGEANYSLVEEFSVEVLEQSFPFIARLMKMPGFTKDMALALQDTLNECTEEILQECIQYEELQRLTGRWDDDDQETKEYWLKKIGFTNNLISSSTACSIKQIENKRKDGGRE